ncbi:MAG TPA: carotenoid oxygenase family protein [Trichocoleus sp.]
MVTIRSRQQPKWSQAVLQPGQEFDPVLLKVRSGAIPVGLRGSLYRNGPARLERGGQPVGHWFDGDGAILGVHFSDRGATGVYRYVQTAGYQQEQQAGKYLLANYGMTAPGAWWQRFGKGVKNAANTSVLALPDKLLALWEGGQPHALNLETLETIGLDDLEGLQGLTYSAHPKCDPKTGQIFNFGVSFGAAGTLHIYRSDRTGKIQQQGTVPLKGLPLIHDFALAGQYLIFCVPPVRLNALPLLTQLQSFSEALQWQPEQGTEIIVINRNSLELVSRFAIDPWFQWHFGNAYELGDGSVVIEIVRYKDFQTNQRLKEVASGQTQTAAESTLWQLRLDPKGQKVIEMQEVLQRGCEFPIVDPRETGQPSRYTYLSMHCQNAHIAGDLYGTIARFDSQTANLTEANLGEGCYPSEPLYAVDAIDPNQGWILTVVYDGNQNQSEVWIFDADRLDDAPVCRLALPMVIPLGFHGTWNPASST